MVLFISLLSCSKNSQNPDAIALPIDTTFVSLNNDSIIWGSTVTCMAATNEHFYFPDYRSGVLLEINKQTYRSDIIGQPGSGPGEFMGPSRFCIVDGLLYIVNEGKYEIDVFQGSEFMYHIPIPREFSPAFMSRFCVKDSIIYFPSLRESPIVCFNTKSEIVEKIGHFHGESDNAPRILLAGEKSFFSIGISSVPIFEEYSYDGVKLNEYDLTQIKKIKEKVNKIQNMPNAGKNTFYGLITDAYYTGGKVYLLIENSVYSFNVESGIELEHIYELKGKYIDTFCVDDSKLFVYEGEKASIDIYNLTF
jgi:hypothetical protein